LIPGRLELKSKTKYYFRGEKNKFYEIHTAGEVLETTLVIRVHSRPLHVKNAFLPIWNLPVFLQHIACFLF